MSAVVAEQVNRMPRVKRAITDEMTARCQALGKALVKRATSKSALSRAFGCSATQIGHILNGERYLTAATQQRIADYLAIPQEMIEGYYLNGSPRLEELFTVPKLTGRIDVQTAVECLNEAPALVRIEQGLQLLYSGLKERDLVQTDLFNAAPSFKAFTDYFNESVAANARIKHSYQAKAVGITENRFEQLVLGEVAPTLEEIGRIAAYYPDPEGNLDNVEYWGALAFPQLLHKHDHQPAARFEMSAV